MSQRKIIGVDPGTNILGYAVIIASPNKYVIEDIGVLKLNRLKDHQEKLKEIFLQLQEIIETYLPSHMAIEAPFYGKNPQSMLKLGRAQGVAMTAAITMGLSIHEYSPKKIKQAVTGNGNASKEQVAAMLETITKVKMQDVKLDATDALAAAICHYHSYSSGGNVSSHYSGWDAFIKANPKKLG
jgi:crossover junction endodeoxyribonuclease RuvC